MGWPVGWKQVLSVVVTVVVGVIGWRVILARKSVQPTAARIATEVVRRLPAEMARRAQPAQPTLRIPVDDSDKTFLDVVPSSVIDLYSSKTEDQAKLATAGYMGKWLRVTVTVMNVSALTDNNEMLMIGTVANDAKETLISMRFTRPTDETQLASLKVGGVVTAIGKFDSANALAVTLRDCELRPN
jgi:hypothetical protein